MGPLVIYKFGKDIIAIAAYSESIEIIAIRPPDDIIGIVVPSADFAEFGGNFEIAVLVDFQCLTRLPVIVFRPVVEIVLPAKHFDTGVFIVSVSPIVAVVIEVIAQR